MILPPGHEAPDFTLQNHLGKRVRLSDLKGPKAVLFFPTAFSFYCGNKIPGVDALGDDMKRMGIRHFLAISRESVYASRNFAEALGLEHYILYSDLDNRVAQSWGTFIPRGSQRVNKRAFLILDGDNIVRYSHDITIHPAEFNITKLLLDLKGLLAGPPPDKIAWEGMVVDESESVAIEAPKVGTMAPDFEVMDSRMNPVALSEYRGKNVVLVFYRYDFCPPCNELLLDLAGYREEFEKRGAVVLAINRDNPYTHRAWADEYGFNGAHLLSDMNSAVTHSWGLYVGGPERAHRKGVFIVDKTGKIAWKRILPSLEAKIPAIDLLTALDRISK
jgi:mycoredoxin-dependent peroxiredoxin